MRRLILLLALIGVGWFVVTHWKPRYTIYDVPTHPVPKNELALLYKEGALDMCADAPAKYSVSVEKCRQGVETRTAQCTVTATAGLPDVIGDHKTSKRLGMAYLSCVLPGVMCNGVEVRSLIEIAAAGCS